MNRKTYSAEKGAQLLQAHRLILHRFDISEGEYMDLKLEIGCRFIETFVGMFLSGVDVQKAILQQSPMNEELNNFFWNWWNLKWMMDDEAFIKSHAYYDQVTYRQVKEAMIGEDLLEAQFLHELNANNFSS